jgi:hypothetical protein
MVTLPADTRHMALTIAYATLAWVSSHSLVGANGFCQGFARAEARHVQKFVQRICRGPLSSAGHVGHVHRISTVACTRTPWHYSAPQAFTRASARPALRELSGLTMAQGARRRQLLKSVALALDAPTDLSLRFYKRTWANRRHHRRIPRDVLSVEQQGLNVGCNLLVVALCFLSAEPIRGYSSAPSRMKVW